jgi:hypothetical protein
MPSKQTWKEFGKHVTIFLAAELLLAGAVWVWRAELYSRVFALFSADVVVAGSWETHWQRDGGKEELHETAELEQWGHKVWGTAKTVAGTTRTYELDGQISADLLLLSYHEVGPNTFDRGQILLRIENGGKRMEGAEIGLDMKNDRSLVTAKYRWELR